MAIPPEIPGTEKPGGVQPIRSQSRTRLRDQTTTTNQFVMLINLINMKTNISKSKNITDMLEVF